MVVDREWGVDLKEAAGDRGTWFSTVRFNDDAHEPVTEWDGPVRHDLSSGTAFLSDDGRYGLFSVHLEIEAGPCSLFTEGPRDVGYESAVSWARERTQRILVRIANRHYSGGSHDLGHPSAPYDELVQLPTPTPELAAHVEELTSRMRNDVGVRWRWFRDALQQSGVHPQEAVVAAYVPRSASSSGVIVVVAEPQQVLAFTSDLDSAARRPAGPHEFDDDLSTRWADTLLRHHIAAAFTTLESGHQNN